MTTALAKRRLGRPPLSPEGTMIGLEVHLIPSQRARLMQVAEERDTTCSALLREMLDQFLPAD